MDRNCATACVIGAGPAGLMAATRLARAGVRVDIFDRMPSPARKFLMAGRGGLNLTHSEPLPDFLARYRPPAPALLAAVRAFPPEALRAFAIDLGEETFVGSSGRVFPRSFKASPLLRAWLRRLADHGVAMHPRHHWLGWDDEGALRFQAPEGVLSLRPSATVLALGGASWPRLGADGGWRGMLAERGVAGTPFRPANMGVLIPWSATFAERWAGEPLKRIALTCGGRSVRGEAMVTQSGLEGGAVYALSALIRDTVDAQGHADLALDLRPDRTQAQLAQKLSAVPPSQSLANRLRKGAGLSPIAAALLREGGAPPADAYALAARIKAVALRVTGVAGLERAISSAGGLAWEGLDGHFMLKALPGVFACGEMLDWEAPTGGYLLQACFATGWAAAGGVLAHLGLPARDA
ncbi:NAD(P)/FAD-dependent oxidoreductase [Aquabacter cavernae]|uniref:NAD(P)/FAD-dependent oxidoreductase n=1 Tax=Aquabacter cavernae TaxID=2496029 RepID=UPI000F8F55F1|nr:TIGR03862 family flavoprotein [Aquabacter cavernae]